MATHSNSLAWRISWTEEPDQLQFMSLKESHMSEHACIHIHIYIYIVVVQSLSHVHLFAAS